MPTRLTLGAVAIIEAIETIGVSSFRHKMTPQRVVEGQVVVARPADGMPIVLDTTAAVAWIILDDWCDADELERRMGEWYPSTAAAERRSAVSEILEVLDDEGLLERYQA